MDIENAMSQAQPGPVLHDRTGKRDETVEGEGSFSADDISLSYLTLFLLTFTSDPKRSIIDKINGHFGIFGSRNGIHGDRNFIVIQGDVRVQVVQVPAGYIGRFSRGQQRVVSGSKSKLEQVVHGCSEFIEFIID
jgi:hypothetical protein